MLVFRVTSPIFTLNKNFLKYPLAKVKKICYNNSVKSLIPFDDKGEFKNAERSNETDFLVGKMLLRREALR